jgi:DamX protein
MDREKEVMMFVSEREPAANQQIEVGILQLSSNEIKPNYYQAKAIEYKQGYVIQIAGFSDSKLWQRFIEQHSSESLFSYQRLLADKDFTVVTSKVYPNKLEAKAAILLLPAQLIERKPWLKPISSVINEINTFTR